MRVTLSLCLLIAYACGLAAGDEQPARHLEKTGGFSFVPPKDWTVKEFPGLKFKVAVGPAADGFAPNINFVDEAFAGKLGEYVTGNKKTLQALFKNYKELEEKEIKTANGEMCIRLVTQSEHNGKALRQSFYFFDVAPGRKLVATCTALADGGDKLDAVFEASLKTFRLEKP
jgi:hypothetical protein